MLDGLPTPEKIELKKQRAELYAAQMRAKLTFLETGGASSRGFTAAESAAFLQKRMQSSTLPSAETDCPPSPDASLAETVAFVESDTETVVE